MIIDLGRFRSPGVSLLSGRDRGAAVREAIGMDEVEQGDAVVRVLVPDDITAISSSFFLALFGESVRNAGSATAFLERFRFEGAEDIITEDIGEGVRLALRGDAAQGKS